MKTFKTKRITIKHILLSAILLFFAGVSFGQTVFWSDNFDAPSGGAENNNNGAGWVLNSEGNSGNRWFVNAPSGIGCSSSGNVLHISCSAGLCGFLGGPDEPIYNAANSNLKTAVSPTISTLGQSNITLSFDFICEGYAGSDFGTLALSSDNGTNWTDLPGVYVEVSSCSTKTITLPAQYQNISTFKMRFKWVETDNGDGVDPPFSVDNIKLTVATSSCTPPTVSAGSNVSICPGGSIAIGGSPTATGGSEAGALVYSWSPATNLSSASVANPTANPSVTTPYTVTVYRNTPSCSATATVTVTVNTPQTLSVSPSGNQTICPGGNVNLSAANGFTNYVWTTPSGTQNGQSITASVLGSYTVSANDANNCLSTAAPINLTSGSSQSITVTPSGPLNFCPGGSVTLTAAAGFTTYTWSNAQVGQSITVTEAGTYSVIGSGSGCGGQSSDIIVTVNLPAALGVTADGSLALCQNGDVVLTAESGFTNYVWSNTQTGASVTITSAGNYTVSAQDVNGCQVQSSVQAVTNDPPFTINVTPSGTIGICVGDNITLTAQSGYSNYVWSNTTTGTTLNVSSAGAYSVSAQNANGCSGTSDAIFVNSTVAPDASFTYLQVEDVYTVNFSSTFNADTYLWNFGNNQTSTASDPSFTFPFDNTYPVTLIATNACGSDTVTVNVVVIKTGIESLKTVNSFSISPNPGKDFFRITGNSSKPQDLIVQIYSLTGQIIQRKDISVKGIFSVDFSTTELASGVYMIQVSDSISKISQKWIKN